MTIPTWPRHNGHPTQPPSGPNNPSPTAELTALTAHLRRVADRVEDLDTRCDQLTDTLTATVLPRLSSIATDTAAQLAEHSERVQQLLDTLTQHRTVEPLNWQAMKVDQAAAAWTNLADWIADTLVPWYEITRDQLPDCWALHRPAVLQLDWLHHTYQSAHQPGASPRLKADWHTRWLPAAVTSIAAAIPRRGARTCGPGKHLAHVADGVRNHPRQPIGPPLAGEPEPAQGSQLAERARWQDFYAQARTADLAWRRARELDR